MSEVKPSAIDGGEVRPWKTGHVGLNVTDLSRSIAFYREIFGFVIIKESHEDGREFAFLSDGERLVLTLWQQSTGVFPKSSPGLHHLSFEVSSKEEVRATEQRVRGANTTLFHDGIVPHAEGAQSGGIFFLDPDGIRLEVYCLTGTENAAPSGTVPTCGFF